MIKQLLDKFLARQGDKKRNEAIQNKPAPVKIQPPENPQAQKEQDKFLTRIYRLVSSHNDGAAVFLLMQRYDYFKTETTEYEALLKRIEGWGPSRTALCIGRLIIQRLHEEKRYGRALFYIEHCQQIRPQFILPDLSQTLFYVRRAIDIGKPEVAHTLLIDPYSRYGDQVNAELCIELLAKIS